MMAGSQQNEPPTAVWNAEKGTSKNLSTGMMKPLYTSCSEHRHSLERNGCLSGPSPIMAETPRFFQQSAATPSPFLRLPVEIRLQIYGLLVLPRDQSHLSASYEKVTASAQDYYDYDKNDLANRANPTLCIRTIDPLRYPMRYPADRPHLRGSYSVHGQSMRFRCMSTTYHCVNIPKIQPNLKIMGVNKQIHNEVAELLYSGYTFDFDTHVEAIVPFLADLTPFARSCIKSIRIVKRALAYQKEFDKCEWNGAMRALTDPNCGISLRRLELGVVAGRPGENGWNDVATYCARDFDLLRTQEGMEWIPTLLGVAGLKELDVHAVVEHCPPGTSSSAMANYIRFSASVDGGFREWLKGQLLS
ncbi:uncharacterized protein RCC_01615 [Ramularia collo-cygni]|uniref:Uncharacterized protein n=1 Tax=Ramularia collo-cygni TaxID=112498 RepID=A0A2D3UMV9_9PEZI|nr:uncharacterized protein RCC_01615 [Ramularia collo-cygni]CZT15781.1 uncharacterized protein RCC_01615 [Ramularia collo-cygni]